jgi:hypothetical protein
MQIPSILTKNLFEIFCRGILMGQIKPNIKIKFQVENILQSYSIKSIRTTSYTLTLLDSHSERIPQELFNISINTKINIE